MQSDAVFQAQIPLFSLMLALALLMTQKIGIIE